MSLSYALQALAWLFAAFVLFVTVAPLRFKPRIPSRVRTRSHVNMERGLAFAATAFLFVVAYSDHRYVVGTSCIVAGGLSEGLQLLSPSRHARWNDALAKAAGAAVGSGCAAALLAWV